MKRLLLTLLILLTLAVPGWAGTKTISDAGGNWNATTTWVEGAVPVNGDSVVATATSGNLAVNVDTNELKDFDLTNYTGTLSGNKYIYQNGTGVIKIPNGVTITYTKAISIKGNATLTAGNLITFPETGTYGTSTNASISLASDVKFSSLYLGGTTPTLTTNNYNITAISFWDHTNISNSTLNLGSSNILLTGATPVLDFTSSTLTIAANTATITITPTSGGNGTYHFGSANWNGASVVINQYSATPGINGTNTFANLTYNGKDNIQTPGVLKLYANQTITNAFTATGVSQVKRPLICSDTPGTARTITMTGATLTLTDVDLKDITVTGSPTITNTRVGDCGNNTGAGTSTPKTVYMGGVATTVAYTGNYWSPSVGTSYANRATLLSLDNFPLPQDTAIIDNYTFSGTSRLIQVGTSGVSGNNRTGAIDAHTLSSVNGVGFYGGIYYGSLNMNSSTLTFSNSSNVNYFDASLGNITLTPYTTAWKSNWGEQSYGNSVLLGGNLTIDAANTFNLTQGTFDLNNYNLTVPKFISSNSNARTLTDSGTTGTLILTGLNDTTNKIFDTTTNTNFAVTSAPNIQIGSSALTLASDVTFMGAGQTYGNFTVKKHAGNFSTVISGTNTFSTVTCETPDVTYQYSGLKFPAGVTTTITSLVADGTADYKISLTSSTASIATLSDTTGTNAVTNCAITWLPVTGGATWNAFTTSGNTVDVNSTGWNLVQTENISGNMGLAALTMGGELIPNRNISGNLGLIQVSGGGGLNMIRNLTGDIAPSQVTMDGYLTVNGTTAVEILGGDLALTPLTMGGGANMMRNITSNIALTKVSGGGAITMQYHITNITAGNLALVPITGGGELTMEYKTVNITAGDLNLSQILMYGRIQEGNNLFTRGGGLTVGLQPSGGNFMQRSKK